MPKVNSSAQRPKASEGESETFDPEKGRFGCYVCSTPEGIGGGIRRTPKLDYAPTIECSTPEGIGGGIRPPMAALSPNG